MFSFAGNCDVWCVLDDPIHHAHYHDIGWRCDFRLTSSEMAFHHSGPEGVHNCRWVCIITNIYTQGLISLSHMLNCTISGFYMGVCINNTQHCNAIPNYNLPPSDSQVSHPLQHFSSCVATLGQPQPVQWSSSLSLLA